MRWLECVEDDTQPMLEGKAERKVGEGVGAERTGLASNGRRNASVGPGSTGTGTEGEMGGWCPDGTGGCPA